MKAASIRRALSVVAACGGVLAAFAGNPWPQRPELALDARPLAADVAAELAAEVLDEKDHVTALELAQWIKERKPGLRVLDLRTPAEFDEYHVPGATSIRLDTLVSTRFAPGETLVLVSDGGAHAAQGWVLLRAAGASNVYSLRGGLGEWVDDVMNPVNASPDVAALSRYFGGLPRRSEGPAQTNGVKEMKRRGC